MSDALPLPPRPNLEQYKKLAKDLQQACRRGDSGAVRDWAARWIGNLAGLQGLQITAQLRNWLDWEAERMAQRWHASRSKKDNTTRCALADAQFFVAREHGFASWPKFAAHLQELVRADSAVSTFEQAVDAIIHGHADTLRRLLSQNPELATARSTRDHRSTLLHYVSANGVEDFRQKTPPNIVEITRMLLAAGADVNAESDAYGGRSTALGLTATSCHPEEAGVQLPLMELLLEHGAVIDGSDGGSAVNGCLHNGRGQAAVFLADRGARLDLEGAAGVGRLDAVKTFFNDDGSLKATATPRQMQDAFAWACQFGHTQVADFLLDRGVPVGAWLPNDGPTGLHWAAYGGHAAVVELLLRRGAPIEVRENAHGGTPLEWALYAWGNSPSMAERGSYYAVVARLIGAGAKVNPQWYDEDRDRERSAQKMRSDPRMMAALRGEMPE